MKFVQERPYAKPELAAKRLLEIAAEIGPNAMGWYYVKKISIRKGRRALSTAPASRCCGPMVGS